MKNLTKLIHITTVPQTLMVFSGQIGYMKDRGYEVSIISSPGTLLEEFGQREQIQIYPVEMSRRITPIHDIGSLLYLWKLLRRLRPQIVHAHTPKGGLLGTIAAWLARVPIRIYHIRGLPYMSATGNKRIILQWTERISCALAHQVLCVSHSIRNVAIEDKICPSSKIKTLCNGSGNGVDAINRFNRTLLDKNTREQVRESFNIPVDALLVGFVGRIVRDKGVIELSEAWQSLRTEFANLHLLLVGPIEPQDPIPTEVLDRLQNDSRVHMTGQVDSDSMASLYMAMDLVTLPTYREGFPNVPLEAASMELPVVASRIPGCVDVTIEGATGLLVPPQQSDVLADAIRTYINDPELRLRHGQAGRERVLREFRPEIIWEALYNEYIRLRYENNLID